MMQVLVAVAIVVTVAAIAVPVVNTFRQRAHKQVALEKIRTLGSAIRSYADQNNGMLPAEDSEGSDSWQNIAKPTAKEAWYNALPRTLGRKAAGDYAGTPSAFYTDENLLFLPGGNYPEKKKLTSPMFAIAFNTKLERNDPSGVKERTKLDQLTSPAKTVVLLEQGLPNEHKTLEVQSKKDYDGSPKGSAKSFVGRYAGQGHLCFADGHVELEFAKDLLTITGAFPFPQTDVVWTRTPEENPNKDPAVVSAKKEAKKEAEKKPKP